MNRLNEYENRPISEKALFLKSHLLRNMFEIIRKLRLTLDLALLIFTLERVNMSSAEKKENNMIFGDVMAVPIECSLKYH